MRISVYSGRRNRIGLKRRVPRGGCVLLSSAQSAGSLPAQQRQGQRLISSMDDLEEVTGCPIGVNRVFRASSRVIGSVLKALGDLELSQSGSAWWCVKKPEPLSRQSMDDIPMLGVALGPWKVWSGSIPSTCRSGRRD